MFIQTLAPGIPAPFVTLMWAETPSSILLASSGYTSTAPPLPPLTLHNLCNWHCGEVGVARRAVPKVKLDPPLRPVAPLRRLHSLLPLHQDSPHYHLAFINYVPLRARHVTPAPCALMR